MIGVVLRSHRKDSECGAMGVRRVQATEGTTIAPPAAVLYAVDPEGVAMISPSACTVVT